MAINVTKRSIKEVFGIGSTTATIPTFEGFDRIPAVDPNFLFRDDQVQILLLWYFKGVDAGMRNLMLFGPHGSGKTELVRQFAARIGVPLFEDVGSPDRLFMDYVGQFLPTKEGPRFVDSMLIQSMRSPQAIFLLNEIDLIQQDTLVSLNNMLDKGVLENPSTSEKVQAAKGWKFVATANTNMAGDSTGVYKGTKRQSAATASRFFMYPCEYMKDDQEKAVLARLGINAMTAERAVRFAAATRKAFLEGTIRSVMTTREVVMWTLQEKALQNSSAFKSAAQAALEMSFLSKCEGRDKLALAEAYRSVTGEEYRGIDLQT